MRSAEDDGLGEAGLAGFLYLLFMSFAVCASAMTVSSKLIRCRDAISLLAIANAVQALTAPNAHRSMHGTGVPGDGSQVMPR